MPTGFVELRFLQRDDLRLVGRGAQRDSYFASLGADGIPGRSRMRLTKLQGDGES